MNRLLALIVVVFIAGLVLSQSVYDYGVAWLFQRESHTWADSVLYDSDSAYFYLTADTLADTILSNPIYLNEKFPGWGNVSISGKLITDSAATGAPDTINSVIRVGMYKGEGYPDYTGIEYHNIFTCTADTFWDVSLVDSGWWNDFAVSRYYVSILETTPQKNKYVIWVKQLRPKQR